MIAWTLYALMLYNPPTTATITWSPIVWAEPKVIVTVEPACLRGDVKTADEACHYVTVFLKDGGVIVVNRHTAATMRCEAAGPECRPK